MFRIVALAMVALSYGYVYYYSLRLRHYILHFRPSPSVSPSQGADKVVANIGVDTSSMFLPTVYIPPHSKTLRVWVDTNAFKPYHPSFNDQSLCQFAYSREEADVHVMNVKDSQYATKVESKVTVTVDMTLTADGVRPVHSDLHVSWKLRSDLVATMVPPSEMYTNTKQGHPYPQPNKQAMVLALSEFLDEKYCHFLESLLKEGFVVTHGEVCADFEVMHRKGNENDLDLLELTVAQTTFLNSRYEIVTPEILMKYRSLLTVMSKFPYTLVFESIIETDFVSDSLYWALAAGSVPIYIGAENVQYFVPYNSVLSMRASDLVSPLSFSEKFRNFVNTRDISDYENLHSWRNISNVLYRKVDYRPAVNEATNIASLQSKGV
jgi:hypothetical protein